MLAANTNPPNSMAPMPAPEPARLIETTAALDARKLRF